MYIVCCHVAPYSGCGYSKRVVEALVRAAGVRNFIETGTFLGHTTRDVAANFPDVNIQTVEVVYSTFKNNEKSFEKFQNIRAVHGESCDFLKEIALEDGPTL